MYWTQFLGVIFIAEILAQNDIRMPPDIIEGPPLLITYREKQKLLQLKCISTGAPKPRFEWKRNGFIVDSNDPNIRWVEPGVSGTIDILEAAESEMGYYQCWAVNSYGTAMSNVSFLQMASLDSFSALPPTSNFASEGDNLYLPCEQLKSVPYAKFSWVLALSTTDKSPVNLVTNERVQIDDLGYLHFAYVKKDDEQNHKLYKCQIFNPEADVEKGGSYANISVRANTPIPAKPPSAAFITKSPLIGLLGEVVKMRCLFYGNPVPTLKWQKANGMLPPKPRWSLDALLYDTEATITNVEMGDAGIYFCNGTNDAGSSFSNIDLKVEAKPVFLFGTNHLSSRNVTEGESVTFSCASNATPVADVSWYCDGKKLKKDSLPLGYHLSSDGLNLTMSELCKNCPSGTDSLAVIQCNASNIHGYVFAQGAVNVILRTLITDGSISLTWEPKMEISFPCHAISDDSTPVTHSWFFDGKPLANDSNIHFDPLMQVLTIKTENDPDEGRSRAGRYRCDVTNGYSNASVEHLLKYYGQVSTGSSDLWWIALLIAIIIALIIVILLVWLFIQRNRGDTYKVDEMEYMNGNDPVKDLQMDGFQDYQRISETKEKSGSKISLASFADKSLNDDDNS